MRTKLLIFSVVLLATFAGITGCSKDDDQTEVYHSAWFNPADFGGVSGDYYSINTAPAITKDIIDNGVVLAYCMLVGDDDIVRPLPAYTNANTGIWDYDIPEIGKIRFTSTITIGIPSSSNLFRYVVIKGTSKLAATGFGGKSMEEISEMPYSDVCKVLGIPE